MKWIAGASLPPADRAVAVKDDVRPDVEETGHARSLLPCPACVARREDDSSLHGTAGHQAAPRIEEIDRVCQDAVNAGARNGAPCRTAVAGAVEAGPAAARRGREPVPRADEVDRRNSEAGVGRFRDVPPRVPAVGRPQKPHAAGHLADRREAETEARRDEADRKGPWGIRHPRRKPPPHPPGVVAPPDEGFEVPGLLRRRRSTQHDHVPPADERDAREAHVRAAKDGPPGPSAVPSQLNLPDARIPVAVNDADAE